MAGINTEVDVFQSGPLFTNSDGILDNHINLMTTKMAQEAQLAVKFQGQTSFRYESSPPTGEWARNIKVTAVAGGISQVTDSGIIYGAWLEGTGSRNYPVTRFKGYFMFRKVLQEIERKAPHMLAPDIEQMARELEG